MKTKALVFLFSLALLPIAAHAAAPALEGAQPATGHLVQLNWTAPSDSSGATTNIYRCVGTACTLPSSVAQLAGSGYSQLANGVAPGTAGVVAGQAGSGTYSDSTIDAGVYSYFVTDLKNGAESLPSNSVTLTVLPQSPGGLVVTKSN